MTRGLRITVVALIALGALSLGSIAWAQEDYPPTPPPGGGVLSETEGRGSVVDPNGDGGVLPFTGGDLLLVVATGAGLVAIGVVFYRRSRAKPRL